MAMGVSTNKAGQAQLSRLTRLHSLARPTGQPFSNPTHAYRPGALGRETYDNPKAPWRQLKQVSASSRRSVNHAFFRLKTLLKTLDKVISPQ